jgi:hypothetical protein
VAPHVHLHVEHAPISKITQGLASVIH